MMAEAPELSRSVPEAAQAVGLSLDRVRMTQRGYARVRLRAGPAMVTRARTDWGLAVLEWIEASAALAAAEDERDPRRAASDSRSRRITVEAGPVRRRIESSWRQYQQVRKSGRPDQIALARAHWREALVDWFQALAQQRAAEDGQRARELRSEPEQPAPSALAPSALAPSALAPSALAPSAPGAAPALAAAAAAARRSKPGYQPLAAGWTPAKRASGS
jgi:hypothetical protein